MQLLIYCAGGFGKEVMDIARRLNKVHARWDGVAFLEDAHEEPKFYGADVFRFHDALAQFGPSGMEVVIATGEPFVRKVLRERIEAANVRLATLVDDTAVVSETANIGAGAIIFPGCFVSSMATLNHNVVMVAGTLIGHDTVLGDNCVISGQVNIGGACTIGRESYVGMGTQIKENTRVGRGTIIGMGSVVFKDIPDDVIALGNPCRPMRPNTDKRVFC